MEWSSVPSEALSADLLTVLLHQKKHHLSKSVKKLKTRYISN